MTQGERIKQLRLKLGMTQEDLGNKIDESKQTIYKYEAGIVVNLKRSVIAKLSEALETTPSYIMYGEEAENPQKTMKDIVNPSFRRVPVVGTIACGTPITAYENIESFATVANGVRCDYALICRGNSMTPRIHNGDLVFIRSQPDVYDGEIAAVLIDDEATLKRVYHLSGNTGFTLLADNPAFPPIQSSPETHILGKAVAFQRSLEPSMNIEG